MIIEGLGFIFTSMGASDISKVKEIPIDASEESIAKRRKSSEPSSMATAD